MSDQVGPVSGENEQALQAEIARLNKIIQALMNRAESNASICGSDFNLFQTAITLEDQVRQRTIELEAARQETEKITRALRKKENNYCLLLENSPVSIHEIDLDGRIISMSRAGFLMHGFKGEAEIQGSLYLDGVSAADRERIGELLAKAYVGETSHFEFIAAGSREQIWKSCFVPIMNKNGSVEKLMGITEDITKRKRTEEKIQYLSTHDVLTGLPNRSMFSQQLNHAIQTARRYQRQFAVLFIDLDRFKNINDTLGHEAGDHLLQQIAVQLKQSLRATDVVARLGGDEFVILIEEVSDPNQVALVANKILTTITKPITLVGQKFRITASIGICIYPKDAEDEQSLIKNSDKAMYLAKEEGKNNYQFYSKEIQAKSLEPLSIETNLRTAIERNELFLHYQAKVDFTTNAITGVEALLRWQNPYLGSVTPTQFIPVAEETGLIVPIGQWVLRTACAQNVAWQRQGLPAVCMAVNLSLMQLEDDNLIADIEAALNDSGMAPNLLELEITESMVMLNSARMISALAKIKDLGVRIAIDNFGTGYATLAHIKHLPIDTLKVDRSFIRNTLKDAEDKAITEAIIGMGKALNLTIVAEGVETLEQMNFLKEHSCDEMQGYYFSKPIMPDQFADLLLKHVPTV